MSENSRGHRSQRLAQCEMTLFSRVVKDRRAPQRSQARDGGGTIHLPWSEGLFGAQKQLQLSSCNSFCYFNRLTSCKLVGLFAFSGGLINSQTFVLSMAVNDIRKLISYRANFHVRVKLQVSQHRATFSFCPSPSSTAAPPHILLPVLCNTLPSAVWSQRSAEMWSPFLFGVRHICICKQP